ncbi:MAG: DsbA family protein [Candidatus Jacksonbacteria bacterium]|jgi:protein-disulfide isomerase|nr:DsbA family protein [Candidatus Jacksonbacteria bacterium]MBT6300919.1 DsbA family protein [Candidatus Jacksonbacteria bacterium]MBT6757386.1 DsbA family protein [Candidatus Jacksonbacteria bacterium]MBT6955326.1 DsbA family protein [Candidatus Jacksonbacteria bacterium]MBT7338933.1 DsbA family protein [Candidatus Jacksonbacteria bacterium]
MSKQFLDGTPPKIAFFLGLLLGVAACVIVGFLLFGQASSSTTKEVVNNGGTVAGDTAGNHGGDSAPADVAPVNDQDHIRGDVDAPITLVEYSDYECSFCGRFHPTAQKLVAEYPNEVRWVYRHFPLTSIHAQARPSAIAAECVAREKGEDAFISFTDAMFANQRTLGRSLYIQEATALGVNQSTFETCLDNEETSAKVDADYQSGITAGVNGTPGNFIIASDGEVIAIPGAQPFEVVKSVVDQLLGS